MIKQANAPPINQGSTFKILYFCPCAIMRIASAKTPNTAENISPYHTQIGFDSNTSCNMIKRVKINEIMPCTHLFVINFTILSFILY